MHKWGYVDSPIGIKKTEGLDFMHDVKYWRNYSTFHIVFVKSRKYFTVNN